MNKNLREETEVETTGSGRNSKDRRNVKGGNRKADSKRSQNRKGGKGCPISKKGNNDPNWYFTDAGLMDTVSKFAFNNFIGYGDGLGSKDIPYAMRIYFNPAAACGMDSLVDGTNRNAGINMAALKLYTTLSAQSGKTSNYGPEDLSILMLALGDLLSFVEYGRRTLGLAFTYNNRNWTYPVDIIEGCGFDDSVLNNLAQKRMDFNITLNSINKIAFPANIAYFYKCVNMYQNIFLDSQSPMAQSYIYLPYSTWVLDEAASETGSVLKTKKLWTTAHTMTWDQYMTILNEMVSAILMSSTYNYIYGDVLNYAAKHEVPLLHLDLVPEDYAVIPVYNELVLTQIHNLNTAGAPFEFEGFRDAGGTGLQYTTAGNDVVADAATGTVKYNPGFAYHPLKVQNMYVDSMIADPDVNMRIDMTRYSVRASRMVTIYNQTESVEAIIDMTLPDHYVVDLELISSKGSVHVQTAMPSEGSAYVEPAAKLSQFDWAPIIYVSDTADINTDFMMFGDFNYYTTLGRDYLLPVNQLCYQGLFELR